MLIKNFFRNQNFLPLSCTTILLLSILLRSMIDIGSDTGIYLSLGKKIANGGRYYYDFFESNFPLSFYLYALEYKLSQLFHINPIILSEIVINSLALLSIFWSSKILKNTRIYDNKAHYNLIIIGYFLGFFLRPNALQIGEFGTKTSLLLLLLFPYISYSFEKKSQLNKKNLIYRGCLMGLMPCLKPHYLIFIIFIELHQFFQKKSPKFFLELDKLVMCLIGASYLFLMLKFTPEFFEFMVPMWLKFYSVYDDGGAFFKNAWRQLATKIEIFLFIFLIFSRLKFTSNDKVLALFFAAAASLIILENISTADQMVIFYAAVTVCVLKFSFDFFASQQVISLQNKIIIFSLFFLPILNSEILALPMFGPVGFVNVWWLLALIYPFLFAKKFTPEQRKKYLSVRNILLFVLGYLSLLLAALLAASLFGRMIYVSINLLLLFAVLFFLERKICLWSRTKNSAKFYPNFLSPSVFLIAATMSCLFYFYVAGVVNLINKTRHPFPSKLYDFLAYYSKIYAPETEDGIAMISIWNVHQFPFLNYMGKEIYRKNHAAAITANSGVGGSSAMFPTSDVDSVFTRSYLFDDLKNQLKNPQVKLLLINNSPEDLNRDNRCLISVLEYYFLDPEFKKIFLENFYFKNHVMISRDVKPVGARGFINDEKLNIFDAIKPRATKLTHDFEVYVKTNPK